MTKQDLNPQTLWLFYSYEFSKQAVSDTDVVTKTDVQILNCKNDEEHDAD